MSNTILYLTDNTLDPEIASACRVVLKSEAGDIPIVSVSQKPIELGLNICVGEVGRNWISLYKQMLTGLNAISTEFAVIAEHDCMYTHEHLAWEPPSSDRFYYNHNHWLVQWGGNHPELNGMYSYWANRTALSQMIASVKLIKESTSEVLGLLEMGLQVKRGMRWHGEFGAANQNKDFMKAAEAAESGYPIQLQRYLKNYVTKYIAEPFRTEIPNLDIRHGTNFTGPKRGKNRTYILPYWSAFDNVMAKARREGDDG